MLINEDVVLKAAKNPVVRAGDPSLRLKVTMVKIIPVAISTAGYCQDIFSLQYLHLPRKVIKLKIGIKSRKPNLCLHRGQKDLPFKKLSLDSKR